MAYLTRIGSFSDEEQSKAALGLDALVIGAQAGNQQAFEMLYARYNDQIHRYLSRMVGNDSIGCELTQETFLKAWSALPGLRTPAMFVNWLYRIALNCARDHQKRQMRMPQVPLDAYVANGETLSVEGPEEHVGNSEMLQIALTRVSAVYRSCLILYVIEELPQRQIAERLNIKENCVSKYVSRGKEELRQVYHQLLRELNGVQAGRERGR